MRRKPFLALAPGLRATVLQTLHRPAGAAQQMKEKRLLLRAEAMNGLPQGKLLMGLQWRAELVLATRKMPGLGS